MNLIIYGPSNSGKTTLTNLLAGAGYKPMLTGDITRMLDSFGVTNMPYVVDTLVECLKPNDYCFDHYYVHTHKQLKDKGPVCVIRLVDKRPKTRINEHSEGKLQFKVERWNFQKSAIDNYLLSETDIVTVYHLERGFDISELIRRGLVGPNSMPVISPDCAVVEPRRMVCPYSPNT